MVWWRLITKIVKVLVISYLQLLTPIDFPHCYWTPVMWRIVVTVNLSVAFFVIDRFDFLSTDGRSCGAKYQTL